MQLTGTYHSPLGEMLLACDELGLTGIWFQGAKYEALHLDPNHQEQEMPILQEAKAWLDRYFAGLAPGDLPPIHLVGTPFQLLVWELLREIPYGETRTYGELAEQIAQRRGLKRMSAQAVGGAVGRNPLSIMIPCHRVVGADGSLTGYAGGVERKRALLTLENGTSSAQAM